jgi:hypothetical protein
VHERVLPRPRRRDDEAPVRGEVVGAGVAGGDDGGGALVRHQLVGGMPIAEP